MCGGRVLGVPCSHVGHNYKGGGHHPYINNSTFLWHNLNRIADVWFDDYKKYYYKATHSEHYNTGDVSKKLKWRKDFGCKSFQWYLDNVLPDMLDRYPITIPPSFAYGVVSTLKENEIFLKGSITIPMIFLNNFSQLHKICRF